MKSLAFGAVAALLLTGVSAQAATIDSTGGASIGNVVPFGAPNTATYGQTFVAADSTLNSFSLFLANSVFGPLGSLDFRGYVGTWDGAKLGTLLYTSATQNKNTDATIEYSFNTGNLAVTAGNTYVAFLSVSELPPQSNALFGMPAVQNTIAGDFVFLNNGVSFESLMLNSWSSFGPGVYDANFKASFSNVIPGVPEPASWAMMLAGFGIAGAAMRRRAKVTVTYA